MIRKKRTKDEKEKEPLDLPGPPGPPPGMQGEPERFHPPMEETGVQRNFPPPQNLYVQSPGTTVEKQSGIPVSLPELALGDSSEGGQLALPPVVENNQTGETAVIPAVVETPAQAAEGTSKKPTETVVTATGGEPEKESSSEQVVKDETAPAKEATAVKHRRVVKKKLVGTTKTSSSIGDALEAWSLDFEKKTSAGEPVAEPDTKPTVEASPESVQPSTEIVEKKAGSGVLESETPAEATVESKEEEVREVVLTCYSCSGDYAATITELPIIVVCPHCGTEGQIDSL